MGSLPDCSTVLLGTGTPNAEPDRSGPCAGIVSGGSCLLVDCGPGVVRRASLALSRGYGQLDPAGLDTVFLTHLHSDHTAGLPDLLLTPWVLGRTAPLDVFGPPGTADLCRSVSEAWKADIEGRLSGDEPINRTGCRVAAHEVIEGRVCTRGPVTVEAFPVRHGRFDARGYRFTCSGRTVVVSGDTAPAESLVDAARGCDMLVHEVYSDRGLEHRSEAWKRYYRGHHTSSSELAAIASEAAPALLVLYHQLYGGVSDEELLEEVRTGYGGDIVSGRDLDVFPADGSRT